MPPSRAGQDLFAAKAVPAFHFLVAFGFLPVRHTLPWFLSLLAQDAQDKQDGLPE
jgi:hypothetical protein